MQFLSQFTRRRWVRSSPLTAWRYCHASKTPLSIRFLLIPLLTWENNTGKIPTTSEVTLNTWIGAGHGLLNACGQSSLAAHFFSITFQSGMSSLVHSFPNLAWTFGTGSLWKFPRVFPSRDDCTRATTACFITRRAGQRPSSASERRSKGADIAAAK